MSKSRTHIGNLDLILIGNRRRLLALVHILNMLTARSPIISGTDPVVASVKQSASRLFEPRNEGFGG